MNLKTVVYCLIFLIILINCDNKKDDPTPGGGSADVGTFAGNMIVADDPQTDAGYIINAKVAVTTSGSTATVKVTGEPGFNRTFTGTYTSHLAGTYDIVITKQTAPVEKVAGSRLIISNNEATITLDVASDEVTVKSSPTSTTNIILTGKLQFVGANLLKQ